MTSSNPARPNLTLWIDADACPRDARDIVMRAAVRRGLIAYFVANTYVSLPESEFLLFRQVARGPDKADDYIVENADVSDLAITDDIPLAARLVAKRVMVVNSRGDELTEASIGERLAMRNLMEELRAAGLATGGPKELGRADLQRFANALDRFLTKRL